MSSDAQIVREHTRRRAGFVLLERAAKARHTLAQAALTAARASDKHPRSPLVAARDAAAKTLRKRRAQIAAEDRIIARHKGVSGMSAKGVAMVAGFEGFRSAPYRDAVGVWTIGYGETKGVGPNTPSMTRTHAMDLLRVRLDRDYLAPVLRSAAAAGVKLTQNEADALGSLVYNLGPGILAADRSLGGALRTRDRRRIADAFLAYDKAGGRVLPGLSSRRKRERSVFLNGY